MRDPRRAVVLTQFLQIDGEWLPASTAVEVTERPPMREVLVR